MTHKLTVRFTTFVEQNQKTTKLVRTWVEIDKATCDRKAATYFAGLKSHGFLLLTWEREDNDIREDSDEEPYKYITFLNGEP